MRIAKLLICFTLLLLGSGLYANIAPVVSGVSASQRTDGSKLVDIYYSVTDADADTLSVSMTISIDNGTTFSISPSATNLSGDIGDGIVSGTNKHIIWNAGAEGMNFLGSSFRVKVTATELINLSSGLVAYFPFNGNANDASGYNHHGTASNVAYTQDRFGNTAKTAFFNGNDSMITIPNQFYLHQNSDATLSFWMKRNDNTIRTIFWTKNDDNDQNRYHIFTGVDGHGFTIDYRDEPGNLHLDPNQGPDQLTVTPGRWTHICVCRTGNLYHLYKDGVEQTVITDPNPNLPNYTGPWRIGKGWFGNNGFGGSLDDIRVYNRCLDTSEVNALYHEGGWEANSSSWSQIGNFPGSGRSGASSFVIGNKAYVVAGSTGWDWSSGLNELWEYDPLSDIWNQKSSFGGVGRFNPIAFSIGNNGYLGTGFANPGVDVSDFWQYDSLNNNWVQKGNFPGGARHAAVGFAANGKGYIATGWLPGGYILSNDVWEYDATTDTWTQKNNFPGEARQSALAVVIGSTPYLGFGTDTSPGRNTMCDWWAYDRVSDTWTRKADFPGTSRALLSGFAIGNTCYIMPGYYVYNGTINLAADCWSYDSLSDIWQYLGEFPGAINHSQVGFSLNGCGYIGFGYPYFWGAYTSSKEFWKFQP